MKNRKHVQDQTENSSIANTRNTAMTEPETVFPVFNEDENDFRCQAIRDLEAAAEWALANLINTDWVPYSGGDIRCLGADGAAAIAGEVQTAIRQLDPCDTDTAADEFGRIVAIAALGMTLKPADVIAAIRRHSAKYDIEKTSKVIHDRLEHYWKAEFDRVAGFKGGVTVYSPIPARNDHN